MNSLRKYIGVFNENFIYYNISVIYKSEKEDWKSMVTQYLRRVICKTSSTIGTTEITVTQYMDKSGGESFSMTITARPRNIPNIV